MKVKNLYKNEMMRYVGGCESGRCSVIELVMVYNDMSKKLGRKIDRSFVRKRVEKFCRKYGKEVKEIKFESGYVLKGLKNYYKFN